MQLIWDGVIFWKPYTDRFSLVSSSRKTLDAPKVFLWSSPHWLLWISFMPSCQYWWLNLYPMRSHKAVSLARCLSPPKLYLVTSTSLVSPHPLPQSPNKASSQPCDPPHPCPTSLSTQALWSNPAVISGLATQLPSEENNELKITASERTYSLASLTSG